MESATLTQLIARVRRMADVESFTARYPDATLTEWINDGITAFNEVVSGGASRVLRTWVDGSATTAQNYSAQTGFARILAVGMTDDNGAWYRLEEMTSGADPVRGTDTLTTISGRPVWWRWDSGTNLYWYPKTDRTRSLRIVGELAPVLLAAAGDTFECLVPGGLEYVAVHAAAVLHARDGNVEQYQIMGDKLVRAETRIRNRARSYTGTPARRRDTRGERELDTLQTTWIWPAYPYYPW